MGVPNCFKKVCSTIHIFQTYDNCSFFSCSCFNFSYEKKKCVENQFLLREEQMCTETLQLNHNQWCPLESNLSYVCVQKSPTLSPF